MTLMRRANVVELLWQRHQGMEAPGAEKNKAALALAAELHGAPS